MVNRETCIKKVLSVRVLKLYLGKTLRYYQAIVILLVAFGCLFAIQAAVKTVDVADVPEEYQSLWRAISYVFTTQTSVILFTFLRNILGYAENWFAASPKEKEKIAYEAGLLGATWAKYQVYVSGFTVAITSLTTGTPYQEEAAYIAGALGLLVDFVTRAITKLAK